MRLVARWRWALPFAQICLMLILVQWSAERTRTQWPYHQSTPAAEGEATEVGWDPRSCWDCDSISLALGLLFLTVLGVFYWVGGLLDFTQ